MVVVVLVMMAMVARSQWSVVAAVAGTRPNGSVHPVICHLITLSPGSPPPHLDH